MQYKPCKPHMTRTPELNRFLSRRLLFSTLLTGITQRVQAGSTDATDDFIQGQMESQHIAGLSLAVARYGHLTLARAYGYADYFNKVPATTATGYKIASISKQFLASAIMVLLQDGKLSLDDPVSTFLSDAPPAWSAIKLRHLLSHTAGLVREPPIEYRIKQLPNVDVVRSAYSVPLVFAPGDKWQYSNLGYFVIAEVISSVSGKPWPDFVQARIFAPANLTQTYLTSTNAPNEAVGHSFAGNDWSKAPQPVAVIPSGAFVSTVLDMARWDAALHRNTVLTPKSCRLMWTRTPLNDNTAAPYGFGWELETVNGYHRVRHGGSLPGFRAFFVRGLDGGLSVVVLVNTEPVYTEPIAYGIAAIHDPTKAGVR